MTAERTAQTAACVRRWTAAATSFSLSGVMAAAEVFPQQGASVCVAGAGADLRCARASLCVKGVGGGN